MDGQGKPNEDSSRCKPDKKSRYDSGNDNEMTKLDKRISALSLLYIRSVFDFMRNPYCPVWNGSDIGEMQRELDSLNELKSMMKLTIDDKENLT